MTNAEIVAAGSELLTPKKIDTNSLYLTEQLNNLGVEVARKSVVGDDRERLSQTICNGISSAQVVIVTGGLGPTEDDLTRDAAAAALGRKLMFDQSICDDIEERFRRFNRKMVEINRRQAYLVEGAVALSNDRGTAPGQWIEDRGRVLILLPGPPNELKSMFERECAPRLKRVLPPAVIRTRHFRVCGMPESDLDQLIAPVYTKYTNPATTILSSTGGIDIHLRAQAATEAEAEALVADVAAQIQPLLGSRIVSLTGEPIEAVIGNLLRERKATLSVAESATGGMLGQWITSVAGSSDYFVGGFLTYTDAMKTKLLGVSEDLLKTESAVSAPVAQAMAEGARRMAGSDYAISITGYAGPEGDTVGAIFVGVATPDGVHVTRLQLPGDRNRIRALAVQNALNLLRRALLNI